MPCSPFPLNIEIQTKNFPSTLLPFETQIRKNPNLSESLSLPHLCLCLSRNFSHLQLACFLSQFTSLNHLFPMMRPTTREWKMGKEFWITMKMNHGQIDIASFSVPLSMGLFTTQTHNLFNFSSFSH